MCQIISKKGLSGEKHSRAKKYKLTSPDGLVYIVFALNKTFCKSLGLTQAGLALALKEKRGYKKWQIEVLNS